MSDMFCFQQDQMEKICFKVISQSISSFSTKENFSRKNFFDLMHANFLIYIANKIQVKNTCSI